MKVTLTIKSGGSVSESFTMLGLDLVGAIHPVLETGTAALSIEVTDDGYDVSDLDATWIPALDDSGSALSIPVTDATTAECVKVDPTYYMSLPRWRLKAVASDGTAVSQTSDREIVVLVRSLDGR